VKVRILVVAVAVAAAFATSAEAATIDRGQAEAHIRQLVARDCQKNAAPCMHWEVRDCTLMSRVKVRCGVLQEYGTRGQLIKTCSFAETAYWYVSREWVKIHASNQRCYRADGTRI
jgi:hypothetical protein